MEVIKNAANGDKNIQNEKLKKNLMLPCTLALACIGADCISAFDPENPRLVDVSSSMRITSISIVVCISSPPGMIAKRHLQLFVLFLCLVVAAFVGTHEASFRMRAFEVFFIVATCTLWVFVMLGEELLAAANVFEWNTDIPPVSMCFAFVAYNGLRLIRHGFLLPDEVKVYGIVKATTETDAHQLIDKCSMCSSIAAACMCASGVANVISSTLALSYTWYNKSVDARRIIVQLSGSACVQTICAVGSMMSLADAYETLPELYDKSACISSTPCTGIRAMRRFNIVSHGAGMCILCCITTVSIIKSLARSTDICFGAERHVISFLFVITALYIMSIVGWYVDGSTGHAYTDAATLIVIIGIVIGGACDVSVGGHFVFWGVFFELFCFLVMHLDSASRLFSYATIVSNVVMFLIYVATSALSAFVSYKDAAQHLFAKRIEFTRNILYTAGKSISFGLMLCSVGLLVAYQGQHASMIRPGVNFAQRSVFAFSILHFAPYIAWEMISKHNYYFSRSRTFAYAWIGSGIATVALYITILFSLGHKSFPTEYPFTEPYVAVAAYISIVLVPWVCAVY